MKTSFLISAMAGFGVLAVGLCAAGDQSRAGQDRVKTAAATAHVGHADPKHGQHLPGESPKPHPAHPVNNHEGLILKRQGVSPAKIESISDHKSTAKAGENAAKGISSSKIAEHSWQKSTAISAVGGRSRLLPESSDKHPKTVVGIGGSTISSAKNSAAALNGTAFKRRP